MDTNQIKQFLNNTTWEQFNDGQKCCNKTFLDTGKMSYGESWNVGDDGTITFGQHSVRISGDELVGFHGGIGLRYAGRRAFKAPTRSPVKAKAIRLFVQTYSSPSPARNAELEACLRINKSNPAIEVIELKRQEKIQFDEYFSIINDYNNGEDVVSIVSNSDIIFDESIGISLYMDKDDAFCLSRYDGQVVSGDLVKNKDRQHLNLNQGSFDSWIFRGVIRNVENQNFYLGVWGCDGQIQNRLVTSGYNVFNPSHTIKTYHIHESGFRSGQFPQVQEPWNKVEQTKIDWNTFDIKEVIEGKNVKEMCEKTSGWHYVKTENVRGWWNTSRPKTPYVLVSGLSDHSVVAGHLDILEDKNLVVWYSNNVAIRHEKLKPFPIGLCWRSVEQEDWTSALVNTVKNPQKKTDMFFSCFSPKTNPSQRNSCLASTAVVPRENLSHSEYMTQMSKSRFVFSPNGCGIDCHRTWEALFCRQIPIITKNVMVECGMYDGLPVVVLDKWEDFKQEEFTEQKYNELMKNFSPNSLLISKWMNITPLPKTKVISYCLYGNRTTGRYVDGQMAIAREYKTVFPGWQVHMAIGDDVPIEIKQQLEALVDKVSTFSSKSGAGEFRRFICDGDFVIYRDIDAKLTKREYASVEKWVSMSQEFPYATWHDHWGHKNPICQGLFGICGQDRVSQFKDKCIAYISSKSDFHHGEDESWLKNEVFPHIKNNCVDFHSRFYNFGVKKMIKLDPRNDSLDVIGDGYGVYPGDSANMRKNYFKSDNMIDVQNKSKQLSETIPTKGWVSFGSIIDDYHDFYEPVSLMWNRFGFKTIYTLICDENSVEETVHGIVVRIKKNETTHTYDGHFGRNYVWQAQISRLWAAGCLGANQMMITSDSDSMPLQSEYFDKLISYVTDNSVSIREKKPYHVNDKYCMMWNAQRQGQFQKQFNANCTFDDFCSAYASVYNIRSFVDDEQFLRDALNRSGLELKFMDFVPVVRVDKINWVYDKSLLGSGGYTDSHLLRPFKQYSQEIAQLMYDSIAETDWSEQQKTIREFCRRYVTNHLDKKFVGTYQWHPDYLGVCYDDGTFEQYNIRNGDTKSGNWYANKDKLMLSLSGHWLKTVSSTHSGLDWYMYGRRGGEIKKLSDTPSKTITPPAPEFSGHTGYEGQMYQKERKALFDHVVAKNSKVVLEVGTWKGGGSTMAIGNALKKTGGKLYTCEPNKEFFDTAVSQLSHQGLLNTVVFAHNCKSEELVEKMISENIIPDFLFFDGPEIPEVAIRDLTRLEPYLISGCVLSVHDWLTDSVKPKLLKPYLSENKKWFLMELVEPPESVGLVFWKYKNGEEKIPKIIHTFWESDNPQLPPLQQKCLDSWKAQCPDYEIKIWNIKNWNAAGFPFAKQAAENKQWAFVSDVARLDVLYRFGGIYLDFDVEVCKSFDDLLTLDMFTGTERTAPPFLTNTPYIFGSKPNHALVKTLLDDYSGVSFVDASGVFNRMSNTKRIHVRMLELGVNNIDAFHEFLPNCVKFPSYVIGYASPTQYAVHHFEGSWNKLEASVSSRTQTFNAIYVNSTWGVGSGPGSYPEYTKEYRQFLKEYMVKNNVKSVLDIGCGDWQSSKFIDWSGISYVGTDVSSVCVENNIRLYGSDTIKFFHSDIVEQDNLPDQELVIIKDVLMHLSTENITRVLKKLTKYARVLIVQDTQGHRFNQDCRDGDYRAVDVRFPPFNVCCNPVFDFKKNHKIALEWNPQFIPSEVAVSKFLANVSSTSTGINTTRYGPNTDCGYVVPDLRFDKIVAIGVGHNNDFEFDYCAKNPDCNVVFFDPFIRAVPRAIEKSRLVHLGLGVGDNMQELQSVLLDSRIAKGETVLLKIDCEGGEWQCRFEEQDLTGISAIAIEFHDLQNMMNYDIYNRVLDRILENFVCVNVHPNNHGGEFEYNGEKIPCVLESTFVRKDIFSHQKVPFPKLAANYKCRPDTPDLIWSRLR